MERSKRFYLWSGLPGFAPDWWTKVISLVLGAILPQAATDPWFERFKDCVYYQALKLPCKRFLTELSNFAPPCESLDLCDVFRKLNRPLVSFWPCEKINQKPMSILGHTVNFSANLCKHLCSWIKASWTATHDKKDSSDICHIRKLNQNQTYKYMCVFTLPFCNEQDTTQVSFS